MYFGTSAKRIDRDGQTALHIAANLGNIGAIKLLEAYGASINALDLWHWTPLHYAARYRHTEAVKLLIRFGAHKSPLTKSNATPLQFARENNHHEVVKLLSSNVWWRAAQPPPQTQTPVTHPTPDVNIPRRSMQFEPEWPCNIL